MSEPSEAYEPDAESLNVDSIVSASTKPSIQHRQETARSWIAFGLLALLAVLMLATFWAVLFRGVEWDNVKDPITFLIGLLIGLVGTVVGFYFGAKSVGSGE